MYHKGECVLVSEIRQQKLIEQKRERNIFMDQIVKYSFLFDLIRKLDWNDGAVILKIIVHAFHC